MESGGATTKASLLPIQEVTPSQLPADHVLRLHSVATVVTVLTQVPQTITASGPTSFCQGGSVDLTASAGTSYIGVRRCNNANHYSNQFRKLYSYRYKWHLYWNICCNCSNCFHTSTPIITASGPTAIYSVEVWILLPVPEVLYLWSPVEKPHKLLLSPRQAVMRSHCNNWNLHGTSAATVVTVSSGSTRQSLPTDQPHSARWKRDLTASAGSSYLCGSPVEKPLKRLQ